jgi:hypothetical protein
MITQPYKLVPSTPTDEMKLAMANAFIASLNVAQEEGYDLTDTNTCSTILGFVFEQGCLVSPDVEHEPPNRYTPRSDVSGVSEYDTEDGVRNIGKALGGDYTKEQNPNNIDVILASLKCISIGVQFSLCGGTGEIKRSDIKRELAEIDKLVSEVEKMIEEEINYSTKDSDIKSVNCMLFSEYAGMSESVKDMCNTAIAHFDKFTVDKHSRWLGFVQGVLVKEGLLEIESTRNATRPLFQEVYQKYNITQERIDSESYLPVAYQSRMRMDEDGYDFGDWYDVSKETHEDHLRVPINAGWEYETRALYTKIE